MIDEERRIILDGIEKLINRLEKRNVCPCCVGTLLMREGIQLLLDIGAGNLATELCQHTITALHKSEVRH